MPSFHLPPRTVSGVPAFVDWLRWGIAEETAEHCFVYDETRPLTLTERMPWKGDCSWWVKWSAWRAGWIVDPTGANWGHWGNSSSIFAYSRRHVGLHQAAPGDIAVFGPGGDVHAAGIVEVQGGNILCSSMGEQGQPAYATVAAMLEGIKDAQGIVTICRADSAARHPVYPPKV